MRRRTLMAVVAGAVALAVTPVMAGAAPLTTADYGKPVSYFRFCAEAQLDTANIDPVELAAVELAGGTGISIGGTIYDDMDDFVSSKSGVSIDGRSILTRSYYDYADAQRSLLKQVRCKLRTAESLDKGAWPGGSDNNPGRFAVDPHYGFGAAAADVVTSDVDAVCSTVNQRTIDNEWDGIVADGLDDDAVYRPDDDTLAVLPDDVVTSGPEWVGLGTIAPPEPLELDGGVLGVRSRALNVPTTSAEGVPRFRGANYCTFVGPEYLRAAILGDVTVA